MKKWMKGLTIAGVVMVFAGTGISAVAGAVGGVRYSNNYGIAPFRHAMDRVFFNHNGGFNSLFSWGYNDFDFNDDYEYDDNDYDNDDSYDDNYEYSSDGYAHFTGEEMGILATISPREEMTLTASYKNIKKLKLSVENGAVKFVENPELIDEVNFYIKQKKHCSLWTEKNSAGTEISVTYRSSANRPNGTHVEGIVEIPAGYRFEEAEIDVAAGEMLIPSIAAGRLSLDAEAGTLSVQSFETDTLSASADAGQILAKGVVNSALRAEAGVGAVALSLKGSEADYRYLLECSMGNIKIGTSEYSGVVMEKRIDNSGAKLAELECSMGSIEVGFY